MTESRTKANLLINTDVDIRVRAATSIDQVAVSFGTLGNLWLDADQAHALVDDLNAALRDLAKAGGSGARQLHRDEDTIRSASQIREDM